MKELRLPSQCALLTEEEQRIVSGGGAFRDALNEFFGSLHLNDFRLGGGLISFSFSFVPMLLVSVVKTGISFGLEVYNSLKGLFGFQTDPSTSEMLQALADAQEPESQGSSDYRSMF